MYKKVYTIYKEGAIFCYFFIFFCKGVFAWGGIIFSKTELAEVGEAPQCYNFSTDFVVFSVVAMTTPSD